ncbi:MAG: hypothetical protein ABI894_16480, partial [Ilumatobacteraceae bacterium]
MKVLNTNNLPNLRYVDRLIAQLAKRWRPALGLLAAIILVAGTATVGERIANDDSRPVVNAGGPAAVLNAVHEASGDLSPAPSVRATVIDASSIVAPLTLLLAVAAFRL